MEADIIAYDRGDRPIALVTVRAWFLKPSDVELHWHHLRSEASHGDLKYLALVDFEAIRILRLADAADPSASLVLPTVEILAEYERDIAAMIRDRQIYQDYFRALVEAWLRDLAYQWHSEVPPGWEPMLAIGLVQALEEGTTRNEVDLDPDPVR